MDDIVKQIGLKNNCKSVQCCEYFFNITGGKFELFLLLIEYRYILWCVSKTSVGSRCNVIKG